MALKPSKMEMAETLILGIQEPVGDIMVVTSIFTVYGWSTIMLPRENIQQPLTNHLENTHFLWLAVGLDTKTT